MKFLTAHIKNPVLERPKKNRVYFRTIILLAYTLLIYATLPVFPGLWRSVFQIFPELFKGLALGFVPVVIIFFLIYFVFIKKKRDLLFLIWSLVFLFSFVPLIYLFCHYPAERFHFAEYGLLAILAYLAFRPKTKSFMVYFIVIIYCLFVGWLDELIQGILPNRIYDFRDILINWASSFLSLGLIAGVTWDDYFKRTLKKTAVIVLIIILMLIGNGTLLYTKFRTGPLNVILLTVDTFRPDRLSCLGYPKKTTPFLDKIAQRGIIYKNVISTAPWTSPGLISIFTGLDPIVHGVQARGDSLLPKIPTIFRIAGKHGYKTPDISYLTNVPNYANLGLNPAAGDILQNISGIGDELLKWIDKNHKDPFLVWYHYRFLHLPYISFQDRDLFLPERLKKIRFSENVKKVISRTIIPHGSVTFTSDDEEFVSAFYDAQLRDLDEFIKKIHHRMTMWKLHKNTLLVITGDHGEELFEHGFLGHASTAVRATLFDEVLKIPLIFFGPRINQGKIFDNQISQVDIMPTILDMADLPVPSNINGTSLLPQIKGGEKKPDLPAFSESIAGGYQSTLEQRNMLLRSIRTPDWKLICSQGYENDFCRLYDLKKDPKETANLFNIEKKTADRLQQDLYRHITEMQSIRLSMVSKNKPLHAGEVPNSIPLQKPEIITPENNSTVILKNRGGSVKLSWTGDDRHTYMIEYDIGKGLKNLKGSFPVQGTEKIFGPLPREAWEPLPEWNPYRIRVSPYGKEELWSEWTEFNFQE